jgi:hypothetical protein
MLLQRARQDALGGDRRKVALQELEKRGVNFHV